MSITRVISRPSRIAITIAVFPLLAHTARSQNASIDWQVFSSGAGRSNGPQHLLLVNVGQNFVDVSSGSNRVLKSGFMVHPLISGTVVSVPEEEVLPTIFNLDQNYPNPFNPSTHLRFSLQQQSHVRMVVYNLLGQEVSVLVDEQRDAGHHTLVWHGTNAHGSPVGSGVYFYRIEARPLDGSNPFVSLKKMIIMK